MRSLQSVLVGLILWSDIIMGQHVPRPAIIGGSTARIGQFPFMVFVEVRGSFVCGGSLIKEGYVLTAKHCVEGESMENISVKLGKHSRTATDENQATSSVSEVIYHSEYDAAILKLECQPLLSSTIGTISRSTDVTTPLTTAGWGWTMSGRSSLADVLQTINIPVVDESACRLEGLYLGEHEFCAGFNTGDYNNVCHGDSGGPIFKETSNNEYSQVGIVLRGSGRCPVTTHYAVFLRMEYITSWITQHSRVSVHVCAAPADPPREKKKSCFPGSSMVTLESGESIPISALQSGDRILAMSSFGSSVYSEFLSFLHVDHSSLYQYIDIYAGEAVLHISAKHLLYKYLDDEATSGMYDFAENVLVGQYVKYVSPTGLVQKTRVTAVATSDVVGAYAPLTAEGTVIVDGIVASCYAYVPSHYASHIAVWPYRMWKSYIDSSADTSAMPAYIQFLETFALPLITSN